MRTEFHVIFKALHSLRPTHEAQIVTIEGKGVGACGTRVMTKITWILPLRHWLECQRCDGLGNQFFIQTFSAVCTLVIESNIEIQLYSI